jgi:hypothetical protein
MPKVSGGHDVSLAASAGRCVTGPDGGLLDLYLCTASAPTKPKRSARVFSATAFVDHFFEQRQPSVDGTCHVWKDLGHA